MIPPTPITPLTSDTPRLRQHVSRSPVARRHVNALLTKAAQIPMALRHHERTLATRSVHTLDANISHETANDPAHQPRAAFTPACLALPSGTAPRKRTSHQARANPNGTATSRTYFGHTVCPHMTHETRSPATRRVYASMFRAPQWHGDTQTHFPPRPRKSQWHCDITNVLWPHGLSPH